MEPRLEMNFPSQENCTIGLIGLGYVGLPLFLEFSNCKVSCDDSSKALNRRVIGYDIDDERITELRSGHDRTGEAQPDLLHTSSSALIFTSDYKDLAEADVFIVTVPTPIDIVKRPDLSYLEAASRLVGKCLLLRQKANKKSAPIVVFESTVYPGATEEICVPLIASEAKLTPNRDFFFGYSPERINPGDSSRTLTSITKVTSGSTELAASWINALYSSVIKAGTFTAASVKVAEAAKVIENTQRDLNIALINELAIICSLLDIDTNAVIEAASTKWNFIPFKPGLVGGHCIGVDPYYLTHKAEQLGYHPEVVLAGRRINDGMAIWICNRIVKELAKRGTLTNGTSVLFFGLTFKENCPDLRNSQAMRLINYLKATQLK